MAHTGSILMNMVAALEMALNNGRHPGMGWDLGPGTGEIGCFSSFAEFFEAYSRQQTFLINKACELNTMLADMHARYRPTSPKEAHSTTPRAARISVWPMLQIR